MDDYISREAVINITAETGAWETQNRVRELPSADVQPVKHGRWILSDDKYWLTCSLCGADIDVSCGAPFFYVDNDEVSHINFCPNCGTRMDGDSNG